MRASRKDTIAFLALSATAVFLSAPAAHAYRAARIGVDQADVKTAPDPGSATASTLTQGTRVNTSDRTVNGYYRVRSANSSGWLPAGSLDFGEGAPPPPGPATGPRPERIGDQTPYETPVGTPHPWAVKAFGGLDFFSPSQVNNALFSSGSTGLNTGSDFGGQIQYGLNASLAVALRIEHLSKSLTGLTDSNGNQVDISLGSTPVMVGLDWLAAKGENFALDFGGFAGEGLSTSVSSTDNSASSPGNVTTYSGSAPTFLLDADLNWMISEPVWLFGELGYRYLATSTLSGPSATGTGSSIFGNPLPSLQVNLSGIILDFGLRINF